MTPSQFDSVLRVRVPGRLTDLLAVAANKKMVTVSDYVRSALVDRLKADGIGAGLWGMTLWGDLLDDPRQPIKAGQ